MQDVLAEAEDRFRRSLAVRESTSVSYNLAMVLEQRGGLVEAQELFRAVVADDDAPRPLRAEARNRARALSPRIARLTVEAEPGVAAVRLDALELSEAMLGVPLPVDPGRRTVVAERDGRRLFERTIELGEGEASRVVVELPTPAAAARTVADGPEDEVPASAGDAVVSEPWLWVLVGVVVAGLVAGGVAIGVAVDEGRYFGGNVPPGRVTVD